MNWLILASLSAFFEAVKDVVSKHNLKANDEYVVTWSLTFFTAAFLTPLLLII